MSPIELDVFEICPFEICSFEVCPFQASTIKVGMCEICPFEVGCFEVGLSQIGPAKVVSGSRAFTRLDPWRSVFTAGFSSRQRFHSSTPLFRMVKCSSFAIV